MYKLLRFYNQNRKQIWTAILVIALIILLYRVLNYLFIQNSNEELEIGNSSINTTTTISSNNINNYSVMTQTNIGSETSNKIEDVVNNFVEYCNTGKVENAYNLLSTNCKNEVYNTLESFKNKYYLPIFSTKKDYEMQAWITNDGNYTYKVKFTEDILSTGKVTNQYIEDYYTLSRENDEWKICINSFIENEEINKSINKDGFSINVKNKAVYMEYEIYELEILNESTNTVMLDTKQGTNSIYIGGNDIEYTAATYEIPNNDFVFNSGDKRTIKLKFVRTYNPDREINYIIFADVRINGKLEKISIKL